MGLVLLATWPLLPLGARAAAAKVKNFALAASFASNLVWAEVTVKHVNFVSLPIDTQSIYVSLEVFAQHPRPSPIG